MVIRGTVISQVHSGCCVKSIGRVTSERWWKSSLAHVPHINNNLTAIYGQKCFCGSSRTQVEGCKTRWSLRWRTATLRRQARAPEQAYQAQFWLQMEKSPGPQWNQLQPHLPKDLGRATLIWSVLRLTGPQTSVPTTDLAAALWPGSSLLCWGTKRQSWPRTDNGRMPRGPAGGHSGTWQELHLSSGNRPTAADPTVNPEVAPWPSSSLAGLWSQKQSCPTRDLA